MKELKCANYGPAECTYVAEGETNEEAKEKIMQHGMSEHAEMMSSMSEEQKQELTDKIEADLVAQE